MLSRQIMLIRHGEKPSVDGSVLGVTVDGAPSPDELSVRGWQRAGALARFFAPVNGVTRAGIRTPEFLFAQGLTQHATSVRAPHTLGPLGALLGKPISTEFSKGQEEQLAGALRALTGPVLVAWEHRAICVLANILMGDDQHTPQVWPDDCFDVVWVFESSDGSSWNFSQVPQLLLRGDRTEPVQ
jgi:hypothetical protein